MIISFMHRKMLISKYMPNFGSTLYLLRQIKYSYFNFDQDQYCETFAQAFQNRFPNELKEWSYIYLWSKGRLNQSVKCK